MSDQTSLFVQRPGHDGLPPRLEPDLRADRRGRTYDLERDYHRLNAQQQRVFNAMRTGEWLTLRQIAHATGDPEASVSARIRDLRNIHGMTINRARTDAGLWRYQLEVPA